MHRSTDTSQILIHGLVLGPIVGLGGLTPRPYSPTFCTPPMFVLCKAPWGRDRVEDHEQVRVSFGGEAFEA